VERGREYTLAVVVAGVAGTSGVIAAPRMPTGRKVATTAEIRGQAHVEVVVVDRNAATVDGLSLTASALLRSTVRVPRRLVARPYQERG
jgi:hypothetical protein